MRKLVLFLYFFTLPIFAAQVPDLYQGQIVVSSQDSKVRAVAVMDALKQVLVKVSGNSAVVNLPAIQQAVKNAENYLQAFTYQDQTNAAGEPDLVLKAEFDGAAIKQLLVQNQQTIWGKNRPLVLVWLAVANVNQAPELANSASGTKILRDLRQDAERRGLPLLFPILDLTDLQALSVSDLWQGNTRSIQQASLRYGADAILVVRLQQQSNNQWNGNWLLLSQNNPMLWNNTAPMLGPLLQGGIDTISDNLAARYSVAGNESVAGNVQLTVANVQNLADYAKVSHYLESLTPVKQIEVMQITPEAVIYSLEVSGGRSALQQALSLDHRLQPVMAVNNNQEDESTLVYQWIS